MLQEKVVKVVDIWRKAETFDADLLASVSAAVKNVESRRSTPGPVFEHNGVNGKGYYHARRCATTVVGSRWTGAAAIAAAA